MKTCALSNGNFFDIYLNIATLLSLQLKTIKQSAYFSPVHTFAKNLHFADFELNVSLGCASMEHLFTLYDMGKMPVHKSRNTT